MVAMEPMSGDIQGFAPSHPVNSSAPPPTIKTPNRDPAGVLQIASTPAPQADPNPAPPSDFVPDSGPTNAPPAPQGEQDTSDFVPDGSQPAPAAAPTAPPEGSPDTSDFEPDPPKSPNMAPVKNYIWANTQVYNAHQEGKSQNGVPKQAGSFLEALEAGWQISVSGLGIREKMPDTILPEHADMAMRIANQIGSLAGDMPAILAGASTAGAIGTAAGTPLVGAVAAAGGSMAFPAALRKIMMDHYERGDILDRKELIARAMATSWEAIKGATTGIATMGAGALAKPVGGAALGFGAELATMTTVGSAMEGHLPEAHDFVDGAIVLGGMHAATSYLPAKLRHIYANTGEHPHEVIDAASRDVELKQDLLNPDPNLPPQATPTELKHESVTPEGENAKPEIRSQLVPRNLDAALEGDARPRTAEEKAIFDKIGEEKAPVKATIEETMGRIYQNHLDYLAPLEEPAKGTFGKENAYVMGRLFAAYRDTVNSFFKYGTRDALTGEKNGEGLTQVHNEIPEGDVNGLRIYGMAERALELIDRKDDKGDPDPIKPWGDFDEQGARKVVADNKEKFGPILQRQIDFGNRVLEWAGRKGLFDMSKTNADRGNPEGTTQLERIQALNEKHFPLNRVQDPDPFTGKVGSGSVLKRIYGSDKKVLDPILQVYRNTEMIVRKALINEVRLTAIENFTKDGLIATGAEGEDPSQFALRKVEPEMRSTQVGSEELARELKKQGFDVKPDDMDIWRPETSRLAPNQMEVYENGKRTVYEGSPDVIDAMKRLEGDRTSIDGVSKFMGFFAKMTRLGVVMNPAFAFGHYTASQITSGIFSKTGLIPFYSSAMAFKEFHSEGEMYQEWLYNRGASSGPLKLDQSFLEYNLQLELDKKVPFFDKAWNLAHSVRDAGEAFIRVSDNMSRLGEYMNARKQGKTPEEAAFLSREVVADYQKQGLQRSILRTGVAFIGGHINHLDQMQVQVRKDPMGVLAKLSVLSFMSAGLWWLNKDDPAIEALPNWQKNQYWNINVSRIFGGYSLKGKALGNWFDHSAAMQNSVASTMDSKEQQEATIFRLRKNWAPGILAGSGMETLLDQLYKDKPREVEDFMHTFAHSVLPDPVFNFLQPILDQKANRNGFTGRPLVDRQKEEMLPEVQYHAYTSDTARRIGKLIGFVPGVRDIGPDNTPLASPAVIENYVHAWGGTVGGWALQAGDFAGRGFKFSDKAEPWENSPIAHSFFTRYPDFANQNVNDFMKNEREIQKVFNTIKEYGRTGQTENALRVMAEHDNLPSGLSNMAKSINEARKGYEVVQGDHEMNKTEKRQLLDTILFQIQSMAKLGNQMVGDFKRQMENNKESQK